MVGIASIVQSSQGAEKHLGFQRTKKGASNMDHQPLKDYLKDPRTIHNIKRQSFLVKSVLSSEKMT